MAEKNLYYFVSDIHLGLNYKDPARRERKFSGFLRSLPAETKALFLLGDIFDFWYEYKNVIPRGFTRTLGALAQLHDRGTEIYFFNGNHDIWTYGYFERELGLVMKRQPYAVRLEGKWFCLGHGDGLGRGDRGYKFLKAVFNCRFLQVLFSGIHPRWAFGLAHAWSKHNRLAKGQRYAFRGEEEGIVRFSNEYQLCREADEKIDYFIFGHFHYKTRMPLKNGGELVLLGEWIHNFDYIVFDGENLVSRRYEAEEETVAPAAVPEGGNRP